MENQHGLWKPLALNVHRVQVSQMKQIPFSISEKLMKPSALRRGRTNWAFFVGSSVQNNETTPWICCSSLVVLLNHSLCKTKYQIKVLISDALVCSRLLITSLNKKETNICWMLFFLLNVYLLLFRCHTHLRSDHKILRICFPFTEIKSRHLSSSLEQKHLSESEP